MNIGFSEYLAMGGYGIFVWSAYGVAVVILGGLAFLSWLKLRKMERALKTGSETLSDSPQRKTPSWIRDR